MASRNRRYTIYDRMEDVGIFEANPANVGSRDPVTNEGLYAGPVPYPKMFYHPEGAMKITVPAEIIVTPFGPKAVGEQRELVNEIVQNVEEEKKLRSAGWHDHPAKALACNADWCKQHGTAGVPAQSPSGRIAELEEQIRRLQAERDAEGAQVLAKMRSTGSIVQQSAVEDDGDEA